MCIQVSHGRVCGSLSVSCAFGDVPFKSRKKLYVFLIQCVGVHILVYFDERMLWMLEISVLNCRMMEGLKDRRWTEAFASMWAALEAAIFELVVNWTLINTGIIMMLFKCISGNLQVLPSLTQLGFCAWCSYGDLCAWSGKNWIENGLWHYQTQVT